MHEFYFPLRASVGNNLIEELADSPMGFADGCPVIGRPGKVSVGKGNSAKRSRAEYLPRRRLSIFAEKESWLRADIRMSPAVQNDSCDILLRIEACARKHFRQLLANPLLVFPERS